MNTAISSEAVEVRCPHCGKSLTDPIEQLSPEQDDALPVTAHNERPVWISLLRAIVIIIAVIFVAGCSLYLLVVYAENRDRSPSRTEQSLTVYPDAPETVVLEILSEWRRHEFEDDRWDREAKQVPIISKNDARVVSVDDRHISTSAERQKVVVRLCRDGVYDNYGFRMIRERESGWRWRIYEIGVGSR